MFDKEAIKQLQEGVAIKQASDAILSVTDAGAVALPENFKLHDLEPYMGFRRRARGVMSTESITDFATYTKHNAQEGATVFVNADEMSATAVLNLGGPDTPGHADNRAKLTLKKTAAYSALKAHASGVGMTQTKAAEFMEDWPSNIKCFNDAGEISPPKAIAAIRKLSIEAMRKLESSEQSLSASKSAFESVQATSADPIPTIIYFNCNPYHGLENREFVLRLAIQTGSDKPAIVLRIVKQEQHDEEMANEFADLTREAVNSEHPVLIGKYSAQA